MFAGKQYSENCQTAPSTDISDQETTTKKPTGSFKQFLRIFKTAPPKKISDKETSTKKPTDSFKQFYENFQNGIFL